MRSDYAVTTCNETSRDATPRTRDAPTPQASAQASSTPPWPTTPFTHPATSTTHTQQWPQHHCCTFVTPVHAAKQHFLGTTMRSTCSGHRTTRAEPPRRPSTPPSTPQSSTAMAAPARTHKSRRPQLCNSATSFCNIFATTQVIFRIRQIQLRIRIRETDPPSIAETAGRNPHCRNRRPLRSRQPPFMPTTVPHP